MLFEISFSFVVGGTEGTKKLIVIVIDSNLFFNGLKMVKFYFKFIIAWCDVGGGFIFDFCAVKGDFGAIRCKINIGTDFAGATNEGDDGIKNCDDYEKSK